MEGLKNSNSYLLTNVWVDWALLRGFLAPWNVEVAGAGWNWNIQDRLPLSMAFCL